MASGCTAASLCMETERKCFMLGANGALLLTLLLYAALIYGAVQLVKYLIRYGIDTYFKKLEELQKKKEN